MVSEITFPTIDVPTCCGSTADRKPERTAHGTRFHFSLNVSDLQRSVAFYRVLFDRPPAKHHPDYAKFELEQPPLVFSLVPNAPASAGALSHFGFPVSSREDVDAAARRLADAGLATSCQQGTVCGYARQDKVWVADPDHNHWEIYVIHEDIDPESVRSAYDGIAPPRSADAADHKAAADRPSGQPVIWEHRVMQPAPERIPHADHTVNEVRLEGTFNSALTQPQRQRLLADVRRVLRPGAAVLVHGLVADCPASSMPTLPGVASLVQRVPVESEPLQELRAAGFEDLRITKLAASALFRSAGAELREIRIAGIQPTDAATASPLRKVVYKGPFAKVVDEYGHHFDRGCRAEVDAATWERLSRSSVAGQFLFLGAKGPDETACGG